MDSRAPAVVAVVVTTGAAPGLETTLSSLAAQDYEELSVLVMANGGEDGVVARVAAPLPTAFVRVLEENRGFAAACNEAVLMVQGAAFLLFCHDDVRFYDGCIRQLVESAYRTNAGIVSPKVVAYDDAYILLHVGQVADRFGTVRERVELGEIDHGQQDLERDVFVAPGGVTLVRTDLFETLHGFDPLIPVLGEDLDLCWRAQIAGARIVVAPAAVIAHRQTIATGDRSVTALGARQSSPRELQRRHQLATVLTCWSRHTLTLVVPMMLALDAGEGVVALLGRDVERARAISGSWRWVWRNRRHLRERRRELEKVRVLHDAEILRLQVGGSRRLTTFLSTLAQEGLDRARGVLPERVEEDRPHVSDGVGFAAAFSEDADFDDVPFAADHVSRWSRVFTSAYSQIGLVVAAAVVWLVTVRDLVATPLPIVGRLAPLSSWWETWRHFFASWSPNGIGTGAPGMPGYGVLAFFGTFVFGRMGILPRAVLLFALPLGALGVWRLLRSVVSNRARLIGALAYLVFPVGANLVAAGRVDALVVAAILPFALRRVLTLVGVPSFASEPREPVPFGHRGWGHTRAGQIAVLVCQTALMTALDPAALVIVELAILAVALALVLGKDARPDRPFGLAGNVLFGTALLLLPLTFDTFAAGSSIATVFGLRAGPWTALSLSAIVRGATGPFGTGWSAWLLPGAAATALVLAREERRPLARLFGALAVVSVLLVTLVGRDWLGDFAPDQSTVMVLVAVAVAALVAVTISVVESDVRPAAFGWRQAVAAVAVLAVVATVVPFGAATASGRFDLPTTGTPETLGAVAPSSLGGYRILWLGEPAALPLPGWSVAPGLAAATSMNSVPNGTDLFSSPTVAAMAPVLAALDETLHGGTVELGQLLAPEGITTVVVMTANAPTLAGLQRVALDSPPATLLPALVRQGDLALSAHTPGVYVFTNTAFHGVISERSARLPATETAGNPNSAAGWTPVTSTTTGSGPVRAGTVLAGLTPASAFELEVHGRDVPRSTSLGGMAVFRAPSGTATIVLRQAPYNGLLAFVTMVLWASLALGFGGLELIAAPMRRRRMPGESS